MFSISTERCGGQMRFYWIFLLVLNVFYFYYLFLASLPFAFLRSPFPLHSICFSFVLVSQGETKTVTNWVEKWQRRCDEKGLHCSQKDDNTKLFPTVAGKRLSSYTARSPMKFKERKVRWPIHVPISKNTAEEKSISKLYLWEFSEFPKDWAIVTHEQTAKLFSVFGVWYSGGFKLSFIIPDWYIIVNIEANFENWRETT